ncbi:uncharacterized protein LOC128161803 isoform X2 [Crassostrea angulata]|uniref:uncharacterized protein LOC128161803 isoform X2 n=1 Tax=Magallana angulata TaxID=2784310 RepID=UPI0022B0BE40|nr:uncharacterized protein LOC128161803 isoform X2 [Crassostrea angulata]
MQRGRILDRTHSLTMEITHTTTLFIAVIAVFDCSPPVTWFDAQTICRNMNQTITLIKNESKQYYWTGLYERQSHWIKIIGCYNESILQYSNYTLPFVSSLFQCQEYCLQQSIDKFAVQGSKCVCLSPDFNVTKDQLLSTECTYTCSNSTLLSTECGGNLTVNVFFTDMTDLNIGINCISLECGNTPIFVENHDCDATLHPLCNTITLDSSTINENWTTSMGFCKENGTYLAGNFNLSNAISACIGYAHKNPHWIGAFRENYLNTDQGQDIKQFAQKFFNTCQRCKLENGAPTCQFVGCGDNREKSKVICSETKEVTVPISETTYKSTTLQETTEINVSEITTEINTGITTEKTTGVTTGSFDISEKKISESIEDSSAVPIAVSVVLVLFLIAGCVIAIIIYKRRKNVLQEKETKSAYCPPANKKSERCSDTKTFDNTNYFVLQRPNSTYELADNFKLELESPYNEAEEGTYDHLGEKRVRKKHDDDTYNHASSADLSDLSDYDVANRKHLNNEDNTYDHTGVGNDSYGKVKSDLSDYDVANREHRNEEDSTYDHTGVDSHGKYNSTQMNETDYSELS